MTSHELLQKQQTKSWLMYDKWRSTSILCPAFGGPVNFTLQGWRHIIGATGHRKRTSDDTFRRLKLLPYAKEIIEKSSTVQNISQRGRKIFYALEAVIEIEENGAKQMRKVRVVCIEDLKKNKIFYSVMDKKSARKKRLKRRWRNS